MITLPPFTFKEPNRDPPHRQHVEAEQIIDGIRFRVASNWPRTRWWLTASNVEGGFFARRSNGLTTGSEKKAAEWTSAVRAGQVRIGDR